MLFLLLRSIPARGRSVHRPKEKWIPTIQTRWVDDNTFYTLRESHLEEYAVFKLFDKGYFEKHLLSFSPVTYRYDNKSSVNGKILSDLAEHVLQEIRQKKKKFTNFTILQHRDFNRRKACGLIVLKFKGYPFVLKLFIETPKSFTNPKCKGFIPLCLFYMSGGVNRHVTGFTRLKNRDLIEKKIESNPYWKEHVSLPRKWTWMPKNETWIEIIGTNIGDKKRLKTKIPSIYGIIADEIKPKKMLSLWSREDRKIALDICNFLELSIDPHINNFMIEHNTKKITIIDTEHFPTIVGLETTGPFSSYVGWYLHLSKKCAGDMLFRSKRKRKKSAQLQPNKPRIT